MKRNGWLLVLMLVICYSVAAFGSMFAPGPWYEGLQRAPWSPPNYAFPIVWTILYAFIAIAGWLIFSSDDRAAKSLWITQLVLNAAWSWLFFGEHWVGIALLDIALLVCCTFLLIVVCWRGSLRTASWLLLPYLLWVSLATTLNLYIWLYN